MPIEYDINEMPGAEQVLNGTRTLLQYLHGSKVTVATALVLVALAQNVLRMSEDRLREDLGMSEAELNGVLQSLHRRQLIVSSRGSHIITDEAESASPP
ncbi:hypothetical protein [Verrucomicrobium spinosum]|uniref:hypothetical protein n=1 Tax=Verrucomicrobium spinosum TaxID=2736 RepID=UPI000AAFB478|nr:hypothetical protein [Verrucomicrobium spinosum]